MGITGEGRKGGEMKVGEKKKIYIYSSIKKLKEKTKIKKKKQANHWPY